jgi:Ca2+-binding RTX toxin-like protein
MLLNSVYALQLQSAITGVLDVLNGFAADPLFAERFELVFGTSISSSAFQAALVSLPPFEVRSDGDLAGALGAFSAQTQKIYLTESLLTGDPARLQAVMIEEIGHFLDAQVNAVDTAGDEGEYFADVVLNKSLSDSEVTRLKTEDDHAVIMIDGQEVAIEQDTPKSINLADLNGNNGFKINGLAAGDQLGFSAISTENTNGDGDDLIIEENTADADGTDSEASYILYDKTTPFAASLSVVDSDAIIESINAGDQSSISDSGIDDFDADGASDVIIGADEANSNDDQSAISDSGIDDSDADGTSSVMVTFLPIDPVTGLAYRTGQWLSVQFKEGVTDTQIQAIASANGATSVEYPESGAYCGFYDQRRLLQFDVSADLSSIQSSLASSSQVESVELNVPYYYYLYETNLPVLPEPHEGDSLNAHDPQLLQSAITGVLDVLNGFAADPLFAERFELVFGKSISSSAFQAALASLPQFEVRSDQDLAGALGAFSAQTQKIYLTESLLTGDPARLQAVMIEEIGHFLDAQVNTVDTAGDEGELFSDLVRGVSLSAAELGRIEAEDDHAVVMIDGQEVAIEQSLTFVRSYNTPGFAGKVHIVGNYAYIGDDWEGLQIIDISKSSPDPIGSYISDNSFPYGTQVVGDYAYIASWFGMEIVNIHEPRNPYFISSLTNFGDGSYNLQVVGNYAYVIGGGSTGAYLGLTIINVSDPLAPNIVSYYRTNSPSGVQIVGDYAYVADGFSGLTIINISNPLNPKLVGSCKTTGEAVGVQVVGDYAYIADGYSGLAIINVHNPSTIQNQIPVYKDTPGFATELQVVGKYVYVADDSGGLQIIDVSTPLSPSIAGSYPDSNSSYQNAMDVQVLGKYAYIANGSTGRLDVVDVSDFTDSISNITLAVSPSIVEDCPGSLIYTFTRTGDLSSPLTVNFSVAGSAVFSNDNLTDYNLTGSTNFNSIEKTGKVTFSSGNDQVTITIDPTTDTNLEGNETVILTLASGINYTIGTTTGVTGTILDDDDPQLFTEDDLKEAKKYFDDQDSKDNYLYENVQTGSSTFRARFKNVTITKIDPFSVPYTQDNIPYTEIAGNSGGGNNSIDNSPTVITPLDSTVKGLIVHTFPKNDVWTNDTPVDTTSPGNNYAKSFIERFKDVTSTTLKTINSFFLEDTFKVGYTYQGNLSHKTGDIKVTLVWTGTPSTNDIDPDLNLSLIDSDGKTITPENNNNNIVWGNNGSNSGLRGASGGKSFVGSNSLCPTSFPPEYIEQIYIPKGSTIADSDYTVVVTGSLGNANSQDFSLFATLNPVVTGGKGFSWGDVHYGTFDRLKYDYQGLGDHILVKSLTGDFQVQTRQESWPISWTPTSVNTAFATIMDGYNIVYALKQGLKIDGQAFNLANGETLYLGNSEINRKDLPRSGDQVIVRYTFTYAGPDGLVSTSDDDVVTVDDTHIVWSNVGDFLGIYVKPADYRSGQLQGLLGNSDGNASNDYTKRDGTQSDSETFARDWLVTPQESLFGSLTSNITTTLNTALLVAASVPSEPISLETLAQTNPEAVAQAFALARDIGIPEGYFLDGAVFDYVVTGEAAFLQAAKQAADFVLLDPVDPLPLASIQGSGWNDSNGNGIWDTGEQPLAGWTVYIDSVNNGQLDPWELSTVTDANGQYTFTDLGTGEYNIREVLQPGWQQTASPSSFILGAGETLTDINFGNVPLPTITLAVSPNTVTEDGTTNLVYTFTRAGDATNSLTVNYAISGTATNGTDYTSIGTSVTFAANSNTATLTIDPTADALVETDETVALILATGTGYTIGTTAAVTGTITNDDYPSITLAVAPASVTEDGTTNLVYTFTRTGPTTSSLTVNYGITGTADATDYTGATPGTGKTITFNPGSATATLTIDPTADTTVEPNEIVTLTLATGTGYTIGTTTAVTGTITNDDSPTISINDITVVEGKDASAFLTISLSNPISQTVSVNYTTTAINATAGSDYTTTSGTLTIAPNSTLAAIGIPILNDDINESLEAFTVSLSNPINAKLNTNASIGEVTISDTWYSGLTRTLPNGVENLTLIGVNAINGTGNSGNNILIGNSANNTLNGSTGVDTLIGGLGNDIYQVDSTTDVITENANEGTDTIQSSVTYTIASLANIENLTLTGSSAINGTGNTGNNVLTGNSANNTLNGGDGNDTLNGGAGNDSLIGGNGNDYAYYYSSTGSVTVNLATGTASDGLGGTDTLSQIENVQGSNTAGDNLTGDANNNTFYGYGGNDILNGGDGNDTLIGGTGNDLLTGGNGTDTAYYYSVTGAVTANLTTGIANDGEGGTDTLSQIENIIGSNTASDNLTGNTGVNVLYGYGGADILTGGGSNDLLYLGSDTVTDTVNYASGDGVDTVYNFVRGAGGDILKFTGLTAIDVQVSGTSTLFKLGDGISGNTGFGTGTLLLTTSATSGFGAADVNVNLLGATFAFS